MLEDVLPCKTTLTVNVVAVKAASTSQSRSTRSTSACTYQSTADNYGTPALFVNSVKLHLTAFEKLLKEEKVYLVSKTTADCRQVYIEC